MRGTRFYIVQTLRVLTLYIVHWIFLICVGILTHIVVNYIFVQKQHIYVSLGLAFDTSAVRANARTDHSSCGSGSWRVSCLSSEVPEASTAL